MKFSARQTTVNSSELGWLTKLPSQVVAEIASRCGWVGLYGQPLNVDVGVALNVLIMSIFRGNGIELPSVHQWLPGLRIEALLTLGREHANWRCDSPDAIREFFPLLSGPESQVRANLTSLLGVNLHDARALLRFHSPSNVEYLTRENLGLGESGSTPRFSIYATHLAEQVQAVVGKPLFISSAKGAN